MKRLAVVVLLASCNPATESVKAQEPEVVMSVAPAQPVKAVEAPKKQPRLTDERCQVLNAPFIQCGWKCIRRTNDMEHCINACRPMLDRKVGNRCLNYFGPGFG